MLNDMDFTVKLKQMSDGEKLDFIAVNVWSHEKRLCNIERQSGIKNPQFVTSMAGVTSGWGFAIFCAGKLIGWW